MYNAYYNLICALFKVARTFKKIYNIWKTKCIVIDLIKDKLYSPKEKGL